LSAASFSARRRPKARARVVMELLPPVDWSDVARQSDLVAIRGEMAELRGELKGEVAELHAQVPTFVLMNVPVVLGVAGLVLAAAKLA
jgi:hypothetical protein